MVAEQNKCRELQSEVIAKNEEVSQLLNIPPSVEISQDFSPIRIDLDVSHWEKLKLYCPSLQPMLRVLNDAQSLCAKVNTLISSSMLIIGPKLLVAWDLIHLLYSTQEEKLKEEGIMDCW